MASVSACGSAVATRTRVVRDNELTAEQCAEAGFELTDDPSEDFNAVRLPASDYDIALFAWVATPLLSSNKSIYVPKTVPRTGTATRTPR